jgi:hypothetical protein
VDADPISVAEEIARILELPFGQRPFRSVIDFTQANINDANVVIERIRREFVTRMGFGQLLQLATDGPAH